MSKAGIRFVLPVSTNALNMGKILIVDGDRQLRGLLAANLRAKGFEVAEASSGWACLQLAETEPLDQIFLSERLPDTDGWATLERLQNDFPALPVLFILENENAETMRRAIQSGACEALAKPLQLHRMTTALKLCAARVASRQPSHSSDDGGREKPLAVAASA